MISFYFRKPLSVEERLIQENSVHVVAGKFIKKKFLFVRIKLNSFFWVKEYPYFLRCSNT